jgi:hypothetical protein
MFHHAQGRGQQIEIGRKVKSLEKKKEEENTQVVLVRLRYDDTGNTLANKKKKTVR